MELLSCVQGEKEPLQDYWQRFVQARARTLGITNEAVILALVNGLRPGPCSSKLSRKPAKTIAELHNIVDKYARADTDYRAKTEVQRNQYRPQNRQPPREPYPRRDQVAVNNIDRAPPPNRQMQPSHKQPSYPNPNGGTLDNQNGTSHKDLNKLYCHFCGPAKGHTTKQCCASPKAKNIKRISNSHSHPNLSTTPGETQSYRIRPTTTPP